MNNFERQLMPILIAGLTDHVADIRLTSVEQVATAVCQFGLAWSNQQLLPAAFQIYAPTGHYLHRVTCMRVVQAVAFKSPSLNPAAVDSRGDEALVATPAATVSDTLERVLLPLTLTASKDEIPNGR